MENAFFIYKGEKMKWLLFCSFYYLFWLEKVSMGISTAKRDLGTVEAAQNVYFEGSTKSKLSRLENINNFS